MALLSRLAPRELLAFVQLGGKLLRSTTLEAELLGSGQELVRGCRSVRVGAGDTFL